MDIDEDSGLNQVNSVDGGAGAVGWVSIRNAAVYIAIQYSKFMRDL